MSAATRPTQSRCLPVMARYEPISQSYQELVVPNSSPVTSRKTTVFSGREWLIFMALAMVRAVTTPLVSSSAPRKCAS